MALEIRDIEINASSSPITVYLAKTKAITYHFTYSLLVPSFSCNATQKLGNLNVLYYKRKNPVELKRCETSIFYRDFYLMQLKPQNER